MRILFVVPKYTFASKVERGRFAYAAALNERKNTRVYYTGPGWEDWYADQTPVENIARLRDHDVHGEELAAVIAYDVTGLAGCPVPVIMQFNEAYNRTKIDAIVQSNMADNPHGAVAVFHYANDLKRYEHFDSWGVQRIHLHHCADAEIYRDYHGCALGPEKDIDVLVVGNMNEHHYPFRVRLKNLALRVLKKRGYKVVILPHPGYELPLKGAGIVGEDYARMLNRSRLVLTCASRYQYALTKYSEIGMCRALAVSDRPKDGRDEFFDKTILRVEPTELDKDIVDKIEHVLDNPEILAKRLSEAEGLTAQTSTTGHYADRFALQVLANRLGLL